MSRRRKVADIEVKIGISLDDLVRALREMSEEDREFLIENLLAATSPEYLRSIEDARAGYKEGRTVPWDEAFEGASPPGMRYKLVITRRAAKDIARLSTEAKERLMAALEKYRQEPLIKLYKERRLFYGVQKL